MFQVYFAQTGIRLGAETFDGLAECHAWIDSQLDRHGWGRGNIVHNGRVISTRSISQEHWEAFSRMCESDA